MDPTVHSDLALEVSDLVVRYRIRRSLMSRGERSILAVDQVNLRLARGETLALVGESGSGKSTIARAICGLVRFDGRVLLDGQDLSAIDRRTRRRMSPKLQMVFQNPYSSLDPSMRVGDSIAEPLDVHCQLSRDERASTVRELLTRVGLDPMFASVRPHALSGGQRQRVAIARAIALDPTLLICDEAVSALDVSTQTQIVELLRRLVTELSISCLFITHDLALVPEIADRVAVAYNGRIVEEGDVTTVFRAPQHPYTQMLLSAVPVPDPALQRARRKSVPIVEPVNSFERPSGCSFHPRCPHAMDICKEVSPDWHIVDEQSGAACHLLSRPPTDELPNMPAHQANGDAAGPPASSSAHRREQWKAGR
jgi:oligopeptide/dipeptide ABC transporter ATP-binding protein